MRAPSRAAAHYPDALNVRISDKRERGCRSVEGEESDPRSPVHTHAHTYTHQQAQRLSSSANRRLLDNAKHTSAAVVAEGAELVAAGKEADIFGSAAKRHRLTNVG